MAADNNNNYNDSLLYMNGINPPVSDDPATKLFRQYKRQRGPSPFRRVDNGTNIDYKYTERFKRFNKLQLFLGKTNVWLDDPEKVYNAQTNNLENKSKYLGRRGNVKPRIYDLTFTPGQPRPTRVLNPGIYKIDGQVIERDFRAGSTVYKYQTHFMNQTRVSPQTGIAEFDPQQWKTIFMNILYPFRGQKIMIIAGRDGVEWNNETIDIPIGLNRTQFKDWYEDEALWRVLEEYAYGDYVMDKGANLNDGQLKPLALQGTIRIIPIQSATPKQVRQQFLDGKVSHCVLQPMVAWTHEKILDVKDKRNKRKYNAVLKILTQALVDYKDGIPQDCLQQLCNDTSFNVQVYLPGRYTDSHQWLNFKGEKGRLSFSKQFKYINSRYNHLDTLFKCNSLTELSVEEFIKKEEQLIKDGIVYGYDDAKSSKNKLQTPHGVFSKVSKYNEAVNNFENHNGLQLFRMNTKKDPELLTRFIAKSCEHNGTVDFQDTGKYRINPTTPDDEESEGPNLVFGYLDKILAEDGVKHKDMEKAYTNCSACSYFIGYPGKLWEFRETDRLCGDGFYQIKDIKNNNNLIKKLGVLHEYNVYYSQELKFYKDQGINFTIIAGAWGSTTNIDWEGEVTDPAEWEGAPPRPIRTWSMLDDELIPGKDKKIKHYCKWFGCAIKTNKFNTVNYDVDDIDYIENITYETRGAKIGRGDQNITYIDNKFRPGEHRTNYTMKISTPKSSVYHYTHIASAILSYQRILMMQQLLKIDYDNIIRVCVDGIYHTGECEMIEPFREKEDRKFGNHQGGGYRPNNIGKTDILRNHTIKNPVDYSNVNLINLNIKNQYELHIGAGGCGKTYKNIMDDGFINPIYIAHSWKLCSAKKEEFNGIHAVPNQRLTFDTPGPDKESYQTDYGNNYNTFIIDEISTMTKSVQDKIHKLYPHHKIVFCGDISETGRPYQCPAFDDGGHCNGFKVRGDYTLIKHEQNRRCDNTQGGSKLQKLLGILRGNIDANRLKLNPTDLKLIIDSWGFNYYSDNNIPDYNVKDLILCRVHYRCYNFDTIYKDLIKYKVINGNDDGLSTSDILYDKPEKGKEISLEQLHTKKPSKAKGAYSIKHGFTIDCIQGETAQAGVYIDTVALNSIQHLYTALSRAKTIEQINFVGK